MAIKQTADGPLHDLTGFQRDLLIEVSKADEKPCGLDIKAAMEAHYEKEIHHGRLYPNLDTLVEKGLIRKGKVDDRTNWYAVTSRGQRELDSHINWMTK